jgi:hypothetical protein
VAGEPKPSGEAYGGGERKIDPGLRPVERARRAEQYDADKESRERRATDELAHEVPGGGHGKRA